MLGIESAKKSPETSWSKLVFCLVFSFFKSCFLKKNQEEKAKRLSVGVQVELSETC